MTSLMTSYNMIQSKCVMLVGFAAVPSIAWFFYNKYKQQSEIVDVLFFSDESAKCKEHADDPCDLPDCAAKNVKKILECLNSAESTLDVCEYFLTYNPIAKAIIGLHQRNVKVRFITEYENTKNDACQANKFRNAGIEVKAVNIANTMHHKFVIIDKKLLITGSANLTSQALFGNFENLMIINAYKIVTNFIEEYERLWKLY